jgi:hypothetical protein
MQTDPLANPYAPPSTAPFLQGATAGAYENERRSVLLLFVYSVLTLGIYPAVWFLRRRRFLDSLDSTIKLGSFAAAPLLASLLSFALAFFALPESVSRGVSLGLGAVTVVTAFRAANILRSDFARTGRLLKVSGIATFFFNALYLQYKINQAADTRVLAATPMPTQGR